MIKKRILFAIILFMSFGLGLLSGSILKHKDGIYQISVERSGISEDIINGETYSYLHSASFIVKVFYNEKEIYSESLEHLIKHKTSDSLVFCRLQYSSNIRQGSSPVSDFENYNTGHYFVTIKLNESKISNSKSINKIKASDFSFDFYINYHEYIIDRYDRI